MKKRICQLVVVLSRLTDISEMSVDHDDRVYWTWGSFSGSGPVSAREM
jgi:hypothetical protein